MIDGRKTAVAPHDLRRTFARRCFDEGMTPIAIKQNLGHSDLATTLRYIGILDVETRRPPQLYFFNLRDLDKVAVQAAI
jgi:integrase